MKFFFQFLIISVCLVGILSSSDAQTFQWKTASSEGFSYQYVENDPAQARFYTLQNGLTVILAENKKEPRVQAYVAVKAGSNTDPENYTGLAHYLEHLLFKGTDQLGTIDFEKERVHLERIEELYEEYNQEKDEQKRKEIYQRIDAESVLAAKYAVPNEYAKIINSLGGSKTNAYTRFNETVYLDNVPSNAVAQYIDLQAERFRNPVFRLFHTELEAVYEEKNEQIDNSIVHLGELVNEQLFPNSYGRQTIIGSVEHLKNPSLSAIKKYYKDYYVPNNMAIIMVGDFSADEVIKMIDKKMSYMQPRPIPELSIEPEKPLSQKISLEAQNPAAEMLIMAYRFDGNADKYAQLLPLVKNILSNGNTGLFDVNIVDKQKAIHVSPYVMLFKDYSVFYIYAMPSGKTTLEELEQLIVKEIQKIKTGNYSEDILASVINKSKVGSLELFTNYHSTANVLLDVFIQKRNHANYLSNLITYKNYTKAELDDFGKNYLNDNYIILYKRKGEAPKLPKIEKPQISTIPINRELQSTFYTQIINQPKKEIQAEFIDYAEQVSFYEIDRFPFLYIKNEENDWFKLEYIFDVGERHSLLLDYALAYIELLGTNTKTNTQIKTELGQLGSSFKFTTYAHKTYITISGLSENFSKTMEIIGDLLQNAVADNAILKSFIKDFLSSRINTKKYKDNIKTALYYYATYGKDNPFTYRFTNKELKHVTSKMLFSEIENLFSYPRTITFYGNIDAEAVIKASLQYFPTCNEIKEVPPLKQFTPITTEEKRVLFTHFDMVQAEINWINNSINYTPELLGIATLFNEYFSGNMSAVVSQTIRESKGLAYSTSFYHYTPSSKNDFFQNVGNIGTQTDKFNEAINAMNELLVELPMNEANFEAAKNNLLNKYSSQRVERKNYIAHYLNNQEFGIDYRRVIYEGIKNTSQQDLIDFYNQYVGKRAYTMYVIASDKTIKLHELEQYGKVQKLTLKDIFGY